MNFVDKQMIINFFTDNACVESGYILDFNRLSFSQFSIRALGKNILMDDLSVGKSLKKFINGASSHDILKFTYYLMEHFKVLYKNVCKLTKGLKASSEIIPLISRRNIHHLDIHNPCVSQF